MLQIDKSRSLAVPGRIASPEIISSAEMLGSYIGFIRRQYPVILFFLLLAVSAAIIYLFVAPPRYTAQTRLMIDTRKVQLFQQQSVLGDVAVDSATVDSQVEAVKSENVALPIIKELHLTEDPEFVGSHGLASVIGLIRGLFTSAQPRSEFELTRSAVSAFQSNLTVKRVGLTYVIEIDYQSLNPERAAQIANAVAEGYIADLLDAKYRTTSRAAIWLQDRLQELRGQASTAERAVLDFKEKNNIVETLGHLTNEQQLAELSSSIVQARAQTAEAKARLDRTQQILSQSNLDAVTADSTVTDTLKDDVITKLRQTYLEYQRKDSEWTAKYGSSHLAVVNARNQMKEIRRSILDELHRIAETYKSDFEIAKAREASVEKSLAGIVTQSQATNQPEVALKELQGTSQTYRSLYDSFLQRYMDTVQQQSFPITEARLITQASRPLGKNSPKSLLVLAVAMAGGGGGRPEGRFRCDSCDRSVTNRKGCGSSAAQTGQSSAVLVRLSATPTKGGRVAITAVNSTPEISAENW
jgi:succinoglycan biosynthesis transport protein ExoP